MDDEGTIHVVEAVLAGVIILTAVLFLTSTSAPSPSAAQSGIDLERTSADTLRILHTRPAADSCDADPVPDPCYTSRLEEIVSHAMGYGLEGADLAAMEQDQENKKAEAEAFLRQVIPVGNRFLLRLDNGEEPLDLLPTGSGVAVTPRAAKAAETFMVPQWQALAGDTECDSQLPDTEPATVYVPGGVGPGVADGAFLEAPTGSEVAPDGGNWTVWWREQQLDDGEVPLTAPYGWWRLDGTCVFVGGVDGAVTDFPVYGVQLVVWPIAG